MTLYDLENDEGSGKARLRPCHGRPNAIKEESGSRGDRCSAERGGLGSTRLGTQREEELATGNDAGNSS